jgi:hypothetical protein
VAASVDHERDLASEHGPHGFPRRHGGAAGRALFPRFGIGEELLNVPHFLLALAGLLLERFGFPGSSRPGTVSE